jgi:hypothetical protein
MNPRTLYPCRAAGVRKRHLKEKRDGRLALCGATVGLAIVAASDEGYCQACLAQCTRRDVLAPQA